MTSSAAESVDNALFCAARDRNLEELKALLKLKAVGRDVMNIVTPEGRTILHFATWSLEATRLLLGDPLLSVNPTVQDDYGNTAVHSVAPSDDDESRQIVELLLRSGADVDARNSTGKTPLHAACIKLRVPVIEALLEGKASVNARDTFGATPLHYVALYRQTSTGDICKQLRSIGITEPESLIRRARRGEMSASELRALVSYSWFKPVDGFSQLVAHGHQLDYMDSLYYSLDLSDYKHSGPETCGEDHLRVITLLLQNRADINTADNSGRTALHAAAALGYQPVVELLVHNRASVNPADVRGTTPLHEAARYNHTDVIMALADIFRYRNACANAESLSVSFAKLNDESGNVASELKPHDGRDENRVYVVTRKDYVALDSVDVFGRTPLHVSVSNKQHQAAHLLVKLGADCNVPDIFGATALHCVLAQPTELDVTLIRLMVENDADCSMQDRAARQTPLHQFFRGRRRATCDGSSIELMSQTKLFELSDFDVADSLGNTPIHVMYERGFQDLFPGRLNDIKNKCGLTPWFLTLQLNPHLSNLKLEYQTAATRDNFGRTALHILCGRVGSAVLFNKHIVRDVLASGDVDLEATDFQKRNILHYACITRKTEIARMLLPLYSDPFVNMKDAFGRTPLHYAKQHSMNDELAEALKQAGADDTVVDIDGVAPSHFDLNNLLNEKMNTQVYNNVQLSVIDDYATLTGDAIAEKLGRLKTDPCAMWRQLQRSRNNPVFWEFLKNTVVRFVNGVMQKVAELDARFQSHPLLVGSSNENAGSKPFEDEFDFLIPLLSFEERFETVELAPECPMFVRFRLRQDETQPNCSQYTEFCSPELIIQHAFVTDRLYALLVEATSYPQVWSDGCFEYLLFGIEHEPSSAAIKMNLTINRLYDESTKTAFVLRRGRYDLERMIFVRQMSSICIDIVPCIRTTQTLVRGTAFEAYIKSVGNTTEPKAYAALKSPHWLSWPEAGEVCTTSFGRTESEIIRQSNELYRAAYALIKSVLVQYVRSRAKPKSTINKYALKCCLLHCIVNGAVDVKREDVITSERLLECIRTILRRLCQVVIDDAVPSEANPAQYLPVWTYEPGPNYCKWYVRRVGLSYSDVIGRHATFCDSCCANQSPTADVEPCTIVSNLIKMETCGSLRSPNTTGFATMLSAFAAFNDFCKEMVVLPPSSPSVGSESCLQSGIVATEATSLVNTALDAAYMTYTCHVYREDQNLEFNRFLTRHYSGYADAAHMSTMTRLDKFVSTDDIARLKRLLEGDAN